MNSKKRGSHNRCSIASCSNTSTTFGVSLHSLPKDPAVSKLWLDVVKIKPGKALKQIFNCSVHFAPNSFELYVPTSHQTRRTQKKNAVPQFVQMEVQIGKFLQDTVHGAIQLQRLHHHLQTPQQHLQLPDQQLQPMQHLQSPLEHSGHASYCGKRQQAGKKVLKRCPNAHLESEDASCGSSFPISPPAWNTIENIFEPHYFSLSTSTSAVGNEGSLEVVEVKEEQVLQETSAYVDVKTESTLVHNEDRIDTILFVEEEFSELRDWNIKTDPTTWENEDKFETAVFVKEEPKILKLDRFDIKMEPTILNAFDYL